MHGIHIKDLCLCITYTLAMWHFRPNVLDIRNWNLNLWEVKLIHNLGLMFLMNNVIPKYMRFTGARRHRNDMGMKKSYATRNYIRLLLHIIGGVGVFFFGGFYLQNEAFFQKYMSLHDLKCTLIFFDLMHQVTIWLMLRNHDGMFVLRSNNLGLALQKVAMDIQLWEAESFEDARPLVAGLFLATAGFALTRLWCFIVAMSQVICGRSFDGLRENWYSAGEWLAQMIIMIRIGIMRENNLPFIICVYWFPHELWNSKKDEHQDIAQYVGYVPASLYFYGLVADVTQRPLLTQTTDLIAQLVLAAYSFYYAGSYFKREPLPGVDYKKTRKTFKGFLTRSVTQARKSIFLYVNSTDAKELLTKEQVKQLKQEMSMSINSSNASSFASDTLSITSLQEESLSAMTCMPPVSKKKSSILLSSPEVSRRVSFSAERDSVIVTAPSPAAPVPAPYVFPSLQQLSERKTMSSTKLLSSMSPHKSMPI